jgi:hypothetical protein
VDVFVDVERLQGVLGVLRRSACVPSSVRV